MNHGKNARELGRVGRPSIVKLEKNSICKNNPEAEDSSGVFQMKDDLLAGTE